MLWCLICLRCLMKNILPLKLSLMHASRTTAGDVLSYKNHNTYKALIGIPPSGAITFVSKLSSWSVSGKESTHHSEILELLEAGDADGRQRFWHWRIHVLDSPRCTVNYSSILKGKTAVQPWGVGGKQEDCIVKNLSGKSNGEDQELPHFWMHFASYPNRHCCPRVPCMLHFV